MLNKIPNTLKIFFILFFVFFITASGNTDSIDGVTHMYLAKKMYKNKSISFTKKDASQGLAVQINKTNKQYYSIYNFGYAILLIPGVALSENIHHLLNVQSTNWPFKPDFIFVLYGNILNGLIISITGSLIYIIIKNNNKSLIKDDRLVFLIIVSILSTNLFIQGHHQFAHPSFILFFLLSFIFLHKFILNEKKINLLLFSCFYALTASVYNATFVLLIPAFIIYYCLSVSVKKWNIYYLFTFAPAILVQLMWNFMRYGNIFHTGYTELKIQLYESNLLNVFHHFMALTFGTDKGFFIQNPLLIIPFIILLLKIIKKVKITPFDAFLTVLTCGYLINYSSATIWHGEATYGPRYLSPLIPVAIIYLFLQKNVFNKYGKLILVLIVVGLFVQLPGLLIPHFSIPYLAPYYCKDTIHRYFDIRCSSIKVGWSHLIRRRIKETIITTSNFGKINTISLNYPDPIKPFRTIYSDPLFDRFSQYKTSNYPINQKMMDDVYSFTLDIWWIKKILYKNIFNL